MNWSDAINDFNNYLKIERGFSVNSISSYNEDISKFNKFINSSKSPLEVSSDDIKEFLQNISKTFAKPLQHICKTFAECL